LLVLLTVCLLFSGIIGTCAALAANETEPTTPIRIACVGDSITYGYLSSNPATKSYPAQLQAMLGDGYTVKNFGVNSATMMDGTNKPYTLQSQYTESLSFNPDIVIIMLGTNDSKPAYWNPEKFKSGALSLVESYKNLPSSPKVYLATSAKCYKDEPNGITGAVIDNEIVPIQHEVAKLSGSVLIDINLLTADRSYLYHSDGIHLSDEGYLYIAQCMYNALMYEAEDVNRDGTVNVGDMGTISRFYGYTSDNPNWEKAQKADVDKNGIIGIQDLVAVAAKILHHSS